MAIASTTIPIAEDGNHYPYHGQTIPGIRFTSTDRAALDTGLLGLEILFALHHLYPTQFNLAKANAIVANTATMQALESGEDPRAIVASWAPSLKAFKQRRQPFLLYP